MKGVCADASKHDQFLACRGFEGLDVRAGDLERRVVVVSSVEMLGMRDAGESATTTIKPWRSAKRRRSLDRHPGRLRDPVRDRHLDLRVLRALRSPFERRGEGGGVSRDYKRHFGEPPVFDMTVNLDGVPEGYAAMDERRALKVLVRI